MGRLERDSWTRRTAPSARTVFRSRSRPGWGRQTRRWAPRPPPHGHTYIADPLLTLDEEPLASLAQAETVA